jgi:hypothetical protein
LQCLLSYKLVRISHSAGFSRNVKSAPKRNQSFRLSQAVNPLSGQSDSGVNVLVNKKRTRKDLA